MMTGESTPLTLYGSPESAEVKAAIEVLDQSGLSYRVEAASKAPAAAGRSGRPLRAVTWGSATLPDFSRQQLIEFLWARGAKFEDS